MKNDNTIYIMRKDKIDRAAKLHGTDSVSSLRCKVRIILNNQHVFLVDGLFTKLSHQPGMNGSVGFLLKTRISSRAVEDIVAGC